MRNTVIFTFIIASCFLANAQTSDRNITIERDYTPVIQDAGKISSTPEVFEKNEAKENVVYSDFDFPLPVSQNIQALSSAKANMYVVPNKDAYLRLGLGNYYNNLFDFFLPILKKPDYNLNFGINHLAAFGERIHSNSKAKLNFDKSFENIMFFAGAGGGYEHFNYYGNYYLNNSVFDTTTYNYNKQSLVRFNAFAGISSMPDAENWRYSGQFKFNLLNAQNGLSEKVFSTPVSLNFYYKDHRVGLDFDFNYIQYTSTDFTDTKAYAPTIINPYYQYENGKLKARLGATLGLSFGDSSIGYGQMFTFAPDAYAEIIAFPKWLVLYGGVGGGLKINTLDKTYSENRYTIPAERIEDTYTPLDIYIGWKLKPYHNVLFDVFADYRVIENQHFFVNQQIDNILTNRFAVEYSRASLIKFGTRLAANFNEIVDLQAKFAINQWNPSEFDHAWHMPAIEADFATNIHITRDITASANVFYIGERTAKTIGSIETMKPVVDVNIGGTYAYANWLSFFVKANNLLNSRYDEYFGYQVQGLNVLVGATVSF